MATVHRIMTDWQVLQTIAEAAGSPGAVTRETPIDDAVDRVVAMVGYLALDRDSALTELDTLRELRDQAAELPCDWTPLCAASQLGRLDYEPPAPAVGAEACDSECPACRLRVRAIASLAQR